MMNIGKMNLYKGKPGTPGGFAHILQAEAGKIKFVISELDSDNHVNFKKSSAVFSLPESEFSKFFDEYQGIVAVEGIV